MSIAAVTPYAAPTTTETNELSSPDSQEESEALQMSDLINQGLASPLYGCTTSQEILDRLSGKSPYVDATSSDSESSAAASTVQAGFQTFY